MRTNKPYLTIALVALMVLSLTRAWALPIITNVVETGGDGTVTAKFTGQTFTGTSSFPSGSYTTPNFSLMARVFVDRAHAYSTNGTTPLPAYLLGKEYIMIRNDNRDNASFKIDVSVAQDVIVYMLVDNRVGDSTATAGNPPFNGGPIGSWSGMTWMAAAGFQPVTTGLNRSSSTSVPDEVGIDESSDGSINNWYSVYAAQFPAGTFSLYQQGLSGNNMYGVVIRSAVPPSPPTNVFGLNLDSAVRLMWSPMPGASAYTVKRATVNGGPYADVVTVSTTAYTDTNLVNGTTYYYVVASSGADGVGGNSAAISTTPAAAPTSVVATGGTNQVVLSWAALVNADTYSVVRSEIAGGPYTAVATGIATTSYTDLAVQAGRQYYYRVNAALVGGGTSGYSAEAAGVTAPSAPVASASLFAATVVRVAWTTPDLVVSQFVIEQSTDGVTFTPIATVPGTSRGYTNAGLALNASYSYRVQAANATGPSDYSAIVTQATPAFGWNVNFANATNGQPTTPAPAPPGYLQDVGLVFGDQGNGFSYGWDRDITVDGRWRQNAISPDLRYDTLLHFEKALPPAVWEIAIPNGFYQVHVVGGDPNNTDQDHEYNIEGVITPLTARDGISHWAEFTKTAMVTDGRLTVTVGPDGTNATSFNAKFCFIDIYPAVPVAVAFSVQPQGQTLVQNRPLHLSASINAGSEPFFYQWYQNGAEVPGASGRGSAVPFTSSLDFPLAQPTNSGNYYVVFTNWAGAVTSSVAAVTVNADEVPPTMVSVGSVDGNKVGLVWDELMDYQTATDMFSFEGEDANGFLGVTDIKFAATSDRTVLTLDRAAVGQFTIKAVAGVADLAGNAIATDLLITGVVANLTPVDVGTIGLPGQTGVTLTTNGTSLSFSQNALSVTADGADIWTVADGMQFNYRPITGNFDVKVRVESLTRADVWSKAGLMARASTNANSRNVALLVTPTTGQNLHTFQSRDTDGAGSVSFYTTNSSPRYPNAWVRLQRFGTLFVGSMSSNNVDWVVYAARDSATNVGSVFPDTLLVGLATTSHATNPPAPVYAEYRDLYMPPPATITTQPSPANLVVGVHTPVSFTVVASAPANSGTITYQWSKDGRVLPGATSDTLSFLSAAVANSGVYTVSVVNDGGGAVSAPVTLTVTNQLPVVVAESLMVTQNVAYAIPAGLLLGNDADPELDPLSIYAVSGVAPVTFATDFNAGLPANATNYGSAIVDTTGGVADSGSLKLTPATTNLSGGFVINELAPGKRVSAFTASFKLRIGEGSAELADGFSFNFANDLPNASVAGAEEGAGTGLSICIDNYRFAPYPTGGTANTAGIKVKFAGTNIAGVQVPVFNSPTYFPVSITLAPDGKVTVVVNGTTLFNAQPTPFVPALGRFGLYARTGGSYETHWVDDLSITALTFDTAGGGTVALTGGNVTYTPLANACGSDSFYYIVTDGQLGGLAVDQATVILADVAAPTITACVTNQTIAANATCQAALPDLKAQLIATDACGPLVVGQIPAPGTVLGLGPTVVNFTITDASNNVATCSATVTVTDQTAPVITTCPANVDLPSDIACQAVLPDMTGQLVATDNCGVASVAQNPAPGTVLGPGPHTVTFTVLDAAGNPATCTAVATSIDPIPPVITACPPAQTLTADAQCNVAAPNLVPAVAATDNCGPLTITQSPAAGASLHAGVTTVIITVKDAGNNQVTCPVSITVLDTTAPVIASCAPNRLVAADTQTSLGTLPDLTGTVTVSDTCGSVTVTQNPPAGTLLPMGVTNITFTVTDPSANSATCVALVTVAPLPSAVVNSTTICNGQSATLTVTTDGANPTYSWAPGGQTTPSITVSPTTTTVYTVTVTDGVTGLSNSAPATVTVHPVPSVAVDSSTICPGGSVTLTAATDTANPAYLWSPGGATTASITVTPTATTTYTVTVTETSTGCSQTGSATVTVRDWHTFANTTPIVINDQTAATPYPSSITVSGLDATLCRVSVTLNNLSHSYPQDIDMVLIAPNGETTYLLSDAGGFDALNNVTVTFDDEAAAMVPENGPMTSGLYKPTNYGTKRDGLRDLFNPPVPVGPYPTNLTQFSGMNPNGTWSLYIMDDAQEDFGAIAGGWSLQIATYTPFADVALTMTDSPDPVAVGGTLTYTLTAANLGPALATNLVLVDTLPAGVTFVSAIASQGSCTEAAGVVTCALGDVAPGATATVTLAVTTTVETTVVNNASLTTGTLEFVTGNNAASTSTVVLTAPSITGAPQNVVECVGASPSFTVVASGSPTLTYQWYHGADPILGATSSVLNLANIQTADLGAYSVVVANAVGSATASATLAFHPTPVITAQPVGTVTPMGNGAAFSVTATSPVAASYQWSFNGTDIDGATGASLTLTGVTFAQAGSYQVRVSNCGGGSVTSAAATLTVTPIAGISFDFNTPLQYSNVLYNLTYNDWMGGSTLLNQTFEVASGGVGGSGCLDVVGSSENTSILMPFSYDFSLDGKALVASAMIKIKSTTTANRALQLGFVTATNVILDNSAGRAYMTLILQSTTTALTYAFNTGHKPMGASTFAEGNNPGNKALVAGNWYKMVARFVNIKGTTANSFTMEGTLQDMGADGMTAGAVVFTRTPVTLANADLVNAKNVYLTIRGFENGGLENWDNIHAYATPGPIAWIAQPASTTVKQGQRAVLSALVDGQGPYAYQWYKNNELISGAQSWKYVIPPALLSDDQAQYTVTVTGPSNTLTSSAAILTVQPEALAVVSVGSVEGNIVGVLFNQPVQEASAEVAANYLINGVPAAKAVWRPDGKSVLLTSPMLLTGAFTVTVQNVLDLSGGTLGSANSANGVVAGLASLDISQANTVIQPVGTTYSFAPNSFEITAGGVDIWTQQDTFRYVYTQKVGDFDVKMRVPYMDIVAGSSKAGLMARLSMEPTSPMVFASPNPLWPGRQYYEGSQRVGYNLSATSWGTTTAASFPNTWLRLRRVANTFRRYSSTDGVNWLLDGQTSVVLPETIYLGMGVCSVRNGFPLTAQIDNYGDFAGYPGALITLTTQPTNMTVAAGSAALNSVVATVTNAASAELAFAWQRNDGSGNWTNLPTAGVNNGNLNTGTLLITDNGAQYRCVVSLLGAASVTSSVVSVTVTDTAAPTITSSAVPTLGTYSIQLVFSEAMGPSALNPANYTVTNSVGATNPVITATFLGGDPRSVVLTTRDLLVQGNYGVTIRNLQDLNGVAMATAFRTVTQLATPPQQPVVMDLWFALPTTGSLTDLVYNIKYSQNTPDLVAYTNVFAVNQWGAANFSDSGSNQYGARIYSYFVPPTNGSYKFWMRADDFAEFIMNTNTVDSTNGAMDVVTATGGTSPAIEQAYKAFDNNIYTKWLCTLAGGNVGAIITPTRGASVVTGIRFTSANDVEGRDPLTWTLEGANSASGPWTAIASGSSGLPATRLTAATAVTFANSTAYTSYRVVFPTTKDPSLNITQIAEIELLNAAGMDITGQDATVRIAMTGANSAYGAGRAFTNTLVAGQRYYIEARFKEGTGGDGVSLAVRNDNTVPGQGEVIPTAFLAFPGDKALPAPVLAELYQWYPTPYGAVGYFGNTLADLNWAKSNSIFYLQGLPTIFGYERYFGYNTNTVDVPATTYNNNYFGRLYSYFVAPTNGLYRFYLRVDDVAQLYMNTNAVASTNPAGKVFMGQTANAFVSGAPYQLAAQNVALNAGQRYYIEVLWKEGTGGDGVTLAVRRQGDTATPPTTEVAAGSLFEYPLDLDPRIGPVDAQLSPINPVVTDGQTLTFYALGVRGAAPYSYQWLKNGQPIYYGVPYLNSPFFVTQPLNAADNGAVITLVLSNAFSRIERSTTITVQPNTPAQLVSVVGSQYGNSVMLTYSEVMDPTTAQAVANYSIPGLTIFSAVMDASGKKVALETSPQSAGTHYTLTVSGVHDRSQPGDVVNATVQFTGWNFGGNGVLVELFTNINGTAIANFTNDSKFIGNFPDVSGYSTRFAYDSRSGQTFSTSLNGYGPFAGDGLSYYGARLSGLFRAPSNGVYRFYIVSDDASQLFMNTNTANSIDALGKVLIAKSDGANTGWSTNLVQRSPDIPLNEGQLYYLEALLKEGGGGDYVNVVVRAAADAVPADRLAEAIDGTLFVAPGNPDINQLLVTEFPPASTNVYESDPILLKVVATRLPTTLPFITYKWERSDDGGATYVAIPGATGPSYFKYAAMGDNTAKFRVTLEIPGNRASYTTTVGILGPDTFAPYIVSANSLDGYRIDVNFSEPVDPQTGFDWFNYRILVGVDELYVDNLLPRPDGKALTLILSQGPGVPLTGEFRVEASGIMDRSQASNTGDSGTNGFVENLTPVDVGLPQIAAGGYNPAVPSTDWNAVSHQVDVSANGWDIWNTADGFHFDYRTVAGNFDVKARVQSFVGADQWSKAGLMARGTTNSNSRFVMIGVTPATSPILAQAPINNYGFQYRDTDAGTPNSIHVGSNNGATVPPAYPNAWVRLQRIGSLFIGYYSSNGTDWFVYGARDTATNAGGAFPAVMTVGLATVSHDQTRSLANNALVEYRDVYFPRPATILVQPSPATLTTNLFATVSYSVVASVPPNSGAITYQWWRNGQPIAGATSATVTLSNLQVSDSGSYFVTVSGDGGGEASTPVTLVVSNSLPIAVTDLLNTPQNTPLTLPVANLLANDSDPEGAALSVVAVSGMPPVTWATDFEGGVPASASFFGTGGGGVADVTGGYSNSGCFKLTLNAASQAGSLILNELTPGKRVASFTANFKLRVGDASAEAADGFSFNFANDLPLAASTSQAAENGGGTGISFCLDNYRFAPFPAGGTANTSGMKVRFGNADIAAVQIPTWNGPGFANVSITLAANGAFTVLIDGTNVFGTLMLPYVPTPGRFGFYARTGGSYEAHTLDDIAITVLTVDTARSVSLSGNTYGNTYVTPTNGVGNSGVLHLTDAFNNQTGSFLLNELTPGVPVQSFTASFMLRIGNGTAEPADGFSFNFASDLINGISTGAEEGVGTGFSFCIDNYRFAPYPTGGTANTAGLKIKYAGTNVAGVQLPANWNAPVYVPVSITLAADGAVTVLVDGTNVFGAVTLPWTPTQGRFGLYARTGGLNVTHWVDDLNISAVTASHTSSYVGNFNVGGAGAVTLNSGVITYIPPANGCGTDDFYYFVTDGQVGGTVMAKATVNITEATPEPPVITGCPANFTIGLGANCDATLPDLTPAVAATDNCCCVRVTQVPAAGTALTAGSHVVTLTATDSLGLTASCSVTLTVVDSSAPALAGCPAEPQTLKANENCQAALPDYTALLTATDCSPFTWAQRPAAGVLLSGGTTSIVEVVATDLGGLSSTCLVSVAVLDQTPPVLVCPAAQTVLVDPQTCQVALPDLAVLVGATDPCGAVTRTQLPAAGTLVGVGVTNVVVTVTDAAGNVATCDVRFEVIDPVQVELTIRQVGANLVISWPKTCTTFGLFKTTSLTPAINWTPVSETPVLNGNLYEVTTPLGDAALFYELRR